ncbi:hypothetical protein ACHQM5_025471 [Ranunculus cassubicifolius]
MAPQKRGSIAFFSTYRPPVRLDIFSCPLQPTSSKDELLMTDGNSYNYSGREIPSDALLKLFNCTGLAYLGNKGEVDSGYLSGMIFVSEREDLELLHIGLRHNDDPPKVNVYNLDYVFNKVPFKIFDGVRMEDSGCFAGDHLIYVSTKEPATERRQPWTAVYKTKLRGGKTVRLTPPGHADLSPSVSPCGKKIAMASFEGKGGWAGEIEDQLTDIYVMNVEEPYNRKLVVKNGGWPTWGSENVIFFHRKDNKEQPKHTTEKITDYWGVYRVDISSSGEIPVAAERVTPDNIDAFTPAAIDATTVAVATIRQKSEFTDVRVEAQYRHIEIFSSTGQKSTQITQKTRPKADHFNPFVIGGGKRIGYHRCITDNPDLDDEEEEIKRQFQPVTSPDKNIDLFRVGGGFPTFSKSGSRLAFVDNDFKIVYVLDNEDLRVAAELTPNSIFAPVWDQNDDKDTLYVCAGPSFSADEQVDILAIRNVSRGRRQIQPLTDGFNNAFPSTNPDGTRLVFRSIREDGYKNLYIMEDTKEGLFNGGALTRLTNGNWTDTQCQWSPRGNWIVFSSTRDKPKDAPEKDHGLDPGYFAVYLVDPDHPDVCVRVIGSGNDLGGHVNHPFFSPDGLSIVVTSDLAAVSVDPISLPIFVHSARPYGDIFTFDIDPIDIRKNSDVKKFNRMTHSRYENSTGTWTSFSTLETKAARNLLRKKAARDLLAKKEDASPCPYLAGEESWQMTGHLVVPNGCS